MQMMTCRTLCTMLAIAGIATGIVANSAIAQDSKPEMKMIAAAAAPAWTNPELEKIGAMLTGSWTSNQALDNGVGVIISAAPVAIEGMTDVMYFETARVDSAWRPYRHGVWHFYRGANNAIHMRTLEFRRKGSVLGSAVGTFAAPANFPNLAADDFVTTLDIRLTADGAGYKGATDHAYPTSVGGATSMTSSISFDSASFKSSDKGMDSAGKQVWGPAAGDAYEFSKSKSVASMKDLGDGLAVVNYNAPANGKVAEAGDVIEVHYVGYLADGKVFDSSYDRGSPLKYAFETKLIEGWNRAMTELVPGNRRRIMIPGALAYGERGRPGVIPPNASLYFDIEVVSVTPAPKAQDDSKMEVKPVENEKKPVEIKPIEVNPAQTKPN